MLQSCAFPFDVLCLFRCVAAGRTAWGRSFRFTARLFFRLPPA
ncbi:hypothetical protein NEIELOOT_03046 [Neisseria elongata subsp. glycolytica ATCC 29315]|uniref:Uncharacterized protein n=1 Tax=Neisseria elongata subsp. glycolytica ATCC 29315 TaxID=546263 RepID=D4DVC8_NEIEG|nr:hypothetical protein NEIELOOT_03046 [Neisseria elongata subsp. glycolytica ATCC 29315]